ncbi:DUF819 family protein [Kroppenstedtia pulmonis]|uniref:DUF819 family protein n=1 Tax=Kroppenstedtia pulmonis TaxID=1380685 RepID=A0A7D4CG10_9BACL|nr:DUF819 family protein [Kroppenstedtia pulmonis]QKG84594.1 DUF819 family protein [Kroppenstedtia pulmonis]
MAHEALITSPFGVGAVITALIALSFWLDRKFRLFSFLGTAIMTITGGAVLVNLELIPAAVVDESETLNPIYVFANDYGIPIAIVLLLLSADLRSLTRLGKPALIAFVLGALGTAGGSLIGVWITAGDIGEEAWKVGGQFAASYIGGGINYAAVGDALGTSATMFATGAAADNIMTNVWMVMTAILPAILFRFYPSIRQRGINESRDASGDLWNKKEVTIYDMTTLIAVTFVIVAVADWVTPWISEKLGIDIPTVILYSTLALIVSAVTPIQRFQGGEDIGNFILHFFFATMGAGTILSALVDKGPVVFLFLVVVILCHGIIVFGLGRLFKVEVEMLAVASQACVGGPSTALALASSKGWFSLMTPAVILGVLGYAVGNYVGITMGYLMKWLLAGG